jgi:hypothetical protein
VELNHPRARGGDQPVELNHPRARGGDQPVELNHPRARGGNQPVELNHPRARGGNQPVELNHPRARGGDRRVELDHPRPDGGTGGTEPGEPQRSGVSRPTERYHTGAQSTATSPRGGGCWGSDVGRQTLRRSSGTAVAPTRRAGGSPRFGAGGATGGRRQVWARRVLGRRRRARAPDGQLGKRRLCEGRPQTELSAPARLTVAGLQNPSRPGTPPHERA